MPLMFLHRGWPARCLAMFTSLMALVGCGGGAEVTDGQSLALSTEMIDTDRRLDVGLAGDGWLVLQSVDGRQRSYSRLGRLALDPDGRMVHADGSMVLGFMGGTNGAAVPMALALPVRALQMTTRVDLEANLDSRPWFGSTPLDPAPVFDPADPSSYSYATSLTIQTPAGSKSLTLYFTWVRMDPTTFRTHWSVHAAVDGQVLDVEMALRFGPVGTLDSWTPATLQIPAQNGFPPHVVDIDLSRLVSFGSRSEVFDVVQDGHAAGTLVGADILTNGALTLRYDSGDSVYAGTVALAQFTAADKLYGVGDSSWLCGRGCTAPTPGLPGWGTLGRLWPHALNTVYR